MLYLLLSRFGKIGMDRKFVDKVIGRYVIRGESGIEECFFKFGELGFCEGHEQGEGEMGVFVCKLMEPWFESVEMRWNMELKS